MKHSLDNYKEKIPQPLYDASTLQVQVNREMLEDFEPLMYGETSDGGVLHNIPNPLSISLQSMMENGIDPFYNPDNETFRIIQNNMLLDQIVSRLLYDILQNTYIIFQNGFNYNLLFTIYDNRREEFQKMFMKIKDGIYSAENEIKQNMMYMGIDPKQLPEYVYIIENCIDYRIATAYNEMISTILSLDIINMRVLAEYVFAQSGSSISEEGFEISYNFAAVATLNDMATTDMCKIAEFVHLAVYKELCLYNKLYIGFN